MSEVICFFFSILFSGGRLMLALEVDLGISSKGGLSVQRATNGSANRG